MVDPSSSPAMSILSGCSIQASNSRSSDSGPKLLVKVPEMAPFAKTVNDRFGLQGAAASPTGGSGQKAARPRWGQGKKK
ncbi:hypothetical protein CEE69_04685 [Rhodopirellula bahusiensis]|uniref:Uncharacterized protein n=1 Tax=Rhodopirellula bahusiensis TaxID=2014065 RepID=A0A2G1WC96_9BACT|nr:hypothetical protein CEE69_04685 [Rhodopirellula bahusiensis]